MTHSASEYRFKHSSIFRILVISLIVTTALYIFVLLLSVSAYPEGCSSWLDYISRLDEFDGIAGLPAFYAAHCWIVDATTIGAVILYGFASMAVFKASGQEGGKSRKDRILSGICIPIMIAFMIFLLFPGAFSDHTIETETYALMIAWSILGLILFNRVIQKDHARTFGKAIIVWMALLAFIIVMSMTLAERVNEAREDVIIDEIHHYIDGTADSETLAMGQDEFLAMQSKRLHDADNISVLVIMVLFGISLGVMLINYRSMQKWEKKAIEERDEYILNASRMVCDIPAQPGIQGWRRRVRGHS